MIIGIILSLVLGNINLKAIDVMYEVATGESYTGKKNIKQNYLTFYASVSMWINILFIYSVLTKLYEITKLKSISLSIIMVIALYFIIALFYIKFIEKYDSLEEDVV